MAGTKEEKVFEQLEEARKEQEDYLSKWKTLEEVYAGDYHTIGMEENEIEDGAYIKTHLMNSVIEQKVAMTMPPPNFKYIVQPADSDNEQDVSASETANSILNYIHRTQSGLAKQRKIRTDAFLLNNAYERVGFRPDTRIETMGESLAQTAEETPDEKPSLRVSRVDTGDKKPGLPFRERIENKNILIARGFTSINDAWAPGGFVARRFWLHEDTYSANGDYKYREGRNKLMPDVAYKGKDRPAEPIEKDGEPSHRENKYMILWEIFWGPTRLHSDGNYMIWSHTQKKIVYEKHAMPFDGINVPIFEVRIDEPREGYHVVPTAFRSINPLLEYERFETIAMDQIIMSKKAIIVDGTAASEARTEVEKIQSIAVISSGNLKVQDVKLIDIMIDTTAAENGALRSRARFEEMHDIALSSPRMEEKVATEMVLRNKTRLSKLNGYIVQFGLHDEIVSTALLTIAKQKMTQDEQVRITRSVEKTWRDPDAITLEGNYAVKVKSSQILDMTQGDYMSTLQQYFMGLANIQAMPQYADKINILSQVKEWGQMLGLPTAGVINEKMDIGQFFEISSMMAGLPADVAPDDPHIKHISDIGTFFSVLDENNGKITEEANQAIMEHGMSHEEIANKQSAGAPKVNMMSNIVNMAREAGAGSMDQAGSAGLPSPIKEANK